ncbi:hypothetical protein EON83_08125 [bacterium]|nr:MAG: hypothetical protein EON83_08125 [bacterium]
MNDINAVKSRAYLTWAEWGPDARIPRDERLATIYPDLTTAERIAWIKEFGQIESFVWQLAEEGKAQALSREDFTALIHQRFPFMDDEAVGKAHFLASYYQWHG